MRLLLLSRIAGAFKWEELVADTADSELDEIIGFSIALLCSQIIGGSADAGNETKR
jgi:hypothetical protein